MANISRLDYEVLGRLWSGEQGKVIELLKEYKALSKELKGSYYPKNLLATREGSEAA